MQLERVCVAAGASLELVIEHALLFCYSSVMDKWRAEVLSGGNTADPACESGHRTFCSSPGYSHHLRIPHNIKTNTNASAFLTYPVVITFERCLIKRNNSL